MVVQVNQRYMSIRYPKTGIFDLYSDVEKEDYGVWGRDIYGFIQSISQSSTLGPVELQSISQ